MKILITGGSGTLGKQLVKDLKSSGHCPVILSRDPSRQLLVDAPSVTGDVRDVQSICSAIKKYDIDCIIHAACNKHIRSCEDQPKEAIDINVNGTMSVCKAIWLNNLHNKPITKFLAISTDKACSPSSVYGMSKYMLERLIIEFADHSGIQSNALRLGNIFGSNGSVIEVWKESARRKEPIKVRTMNGKDMLKFAILPQDAASACIHAIDSNRNKTIFCLKSRVVNITTLASVFKNRYNITTSHEPALIYEKEHEQFINRLESTRTEIANGYLYLTDTIQDQSADWEYSTRSETPLNFDETEKFLDQVLECYGGQ